MKNINVVHNVKSTPVPDDDDDDANSVTHITTRCALRIERATVSETDGCTHSFVDCPIGAGGATKEYEIEHATSAIYTDGTWTCVDLSTAPARTGDADRPTEWVKGIVSLAPSARATKAESEVAQLVDWWIANEGTTTWGTTLATRANDTKLETMNFYHTTADKECDVVLVVSGANYMLHRSLMADAHKAYIEARS
jgi:hypothetical protein